eukprot:7281006-Karenia_brevis.AAC.1
MSHDGSRAVQFLGRQHLAEKGDDTSAKSGFEKTKRSVALARDKHGPVAITLTSYAAQPSLAILHEVIDACAKGVTRACEGDFGCC